MHNLDILLGAFHFGMVSTPIQTQTILEVDRQQLNFELVRAALPLINGH